MYWSETFTWSSAAPVSLFNLSDQFISGKLSPDDQDQTLNDILGAVHVQQTTNHNRQTARVHLEHNQSHLAYVCNARMLCNSNFCVFCSEPHLLNIDLNVLLQVVAIQVEDQVVDKVETVADDDERQLVGEFGFLFATKSGGRESASYGNQHKNNYKSEKTSAKLDAPQETLSSIMTRFCMMDFPGAFSR